MHHRLTTLGASKACVGYLSMPLAAGGIAHVTVN